jgi:hypothetical protein
LPVQPAADGGQKRQLVGILERRRGLSVLAIYGDCKRIPEAGMRARLGVGGSGTQQAESIVDAGAGGKFQGIPLSSEEVFKGTEIEQMNSHS